jgi:hypothetical protein
MKVDIWPTAHKKKSTRNTEVIGSSIDLTGTPPRTAEFGGNGGPGVFELICVGVGFRTEAVQGGGISYCCTL